MDISIDIKVPDDAEIGETFELEFIVPISWDDDIDITASIDVKGGGTDVFAETLTELLLPMLLLIVVIIMAVVIYKRR